MFKSGHNTDCLRLFQPGDKVLIRKHTIGTRLMTITKQRYIVIAKKHSNSVNYYVKRLETSTDC